MARTFQIPSGTTIRFGAPARPLPGDIQAKLKTGLCSIKGIIEAHLPLCQVVISMPEPAQILIVVLSKGTSTESVLPQVEEMVRTVLPEGCFLDVWPLHSRDSLLAAIRKVNCCLVQPAPEPWWKFGR